MELEQRVKALEFEMKILKNEVQRTLLDIQEQVLVHYYPTLRTDETKPSDGTIQVIETLRSIRPREASAAPAPVPEVRPARPVPAMKTVTLEEVRAVQNRLAGDPAEEPAGTAPQVDAGSNGNTNSNAHSSGSEAAVDRSNLQLSEFLAANEPRAQDDNEQGTLDLLTNLNSLVERAGGLEEALRMLKEAKVG